MSVCLVGVVPGFLMEKVPAMLGCELLSPSLEEPEELDSNSGMKRRRRRSLGGELPPAVHVEGRVPCGLPATMRGYSYSSGECMCVLAIVGEDVHRMKAV